MNDIQKARDVLAKWRDEATEGKWEHHEDGIVLVNDYVQSGDTTVAEDLFTADARLIVGTAGNPDLLDAIDGMLREASCWPNSTELADSAMTAFVATAERLAAAIIAAEERMQQ